MEALQKQVDRYYPEIAEEEEEPEEEGECIMTFILWGVIEPVSIM